MGWKFSYGGWRSWTPSEPSTSWGYQNLNPSINTGTIGGGSAAYVMGPKPTSVWSWIGQGMTPGIGYAAKAHKGIYVQINWKEFNRWVAAQIAAGNTGAKRAIFNIGKILFGKIKNRNPVLTGLSKAAWELRIKGLADINPYVIIANQVYYTVKLEFGSSRKAPHGMVRISIKEMMGIPAKEMLIQISKERVKFMTSSAKIPAGVTRTLNLPFGGNI
jgi:hypothetical protein